MLREGFEEFFKNNTVEMDNEEEDNESTDMPFKCYIPGCIQKFSNAFALGGHCSKSHPGLSPIYNHKKQVRQKRELERDLHKEALEVYAKIENNASIIDQDDLSNINRTALRKIKKDLVTNVQKYRTL